MFNVLNADVENSNSSVHLPWLHERMSYLTEFHCLVYNVHLKQKQICCTTFISFSYTYKGMYIFLTCVLLHRNFKTVIICYPSICSVRISPLYFPLPSVCSHSAYFIRLSSLHITFCSFLFSNITILILTQLAPPFKNKRVILETQDGCNSRHFTLWANRHKFGNCCARSTSFHMTSL